MVERYRNSSNLHEIIVNIAEHVYDNHQHCTDDCPYKNNPDSHRELPSKNRNGQAAIKKLLIDFFTSDVVEGLRVDAGTQLNESFHFEVTRYAPKDRHYSSSTSFANRVALTVLAHNNRKGFLSEVGTAL